MRFSFPLRWLKERSKEPSGTRGRGGSLPRRSTHSLNLRLRLRLRNILTPWPRHPLQGGPLFLSEAVRHSEDSCITANSGPQYWKEIGGLSDVVHEVGALHQEKVDDFLIVGNRFVEGYSPQAYCSGKVLVQHSGAWNVFKFKLDFLVNNRPHLAFELKISLNFNFEKKLKLK